MFYVILQGLNAFIIRFCFQFFFDFIETCNTLLVDFVFAKAFCTLFSMAFYLCYGKQLFSFVWSHISAFQQYKTYLTGMSSLQHTVLDHFRH